MFHLLSMEVRLVAHYPQWFIKIERIMEELGNYVEWRASIGEIYCLHLVLFLEHYTNCLLITF